MGRCNLRRDVTEGHHMRAYLEITSSPPHLPDIPHPLTPCFIHPFPCRMSRLSTATLIRFSSTSTYGVHIGLIMYNRIS